MIFKIILTLLILTYLVQSDVNVTNVYDAIVIGGGVAGLAACSQLAQNGVQNILLIEAKNRLGGRVNTIQYSKFFGIILIK